MGKGDSCEAGHPFPAGQLISFLFIYIYIKSKKEIREARAGEKQSNEKRAAAFVDWGCFAGERGGVLLLCSFA